MTPKNKSRWKHHGIVKTSGQDKRLSFLCGFFFVFATVIFLRLVVLQIIGHGFYEALASGQHELYRELIPTRGIIFMKDGQEGDPVAVATNQERAFIYAEPRRILDPEVTSQALGTLFGYGEEEIALLQERLDQPEDPYEPIERDVSEETLQQILALALPGIHYERVPSRLYPEGLIGGHLLGFLGSNEDGIRSGRYGLEGYFDELLSGT